jgi:hypothetical protein
LDIPPRAQTTRTRCMSLLVAAGSRVPRTQRTMPKVTRPPVPGSALRVRTLRDRTRATLVASQNKSAHVAGLLPGARLPAPRSLPNVKRGLSR